MILWTEASPTASERPLNSDPAAPSHPPQTIALWRRECVRSATELEAIVAIDMRLALACERL